MRMWPPLHKIVSILHSIRHRTATHENCVVYIQYLLIHKGCYTQVFVSKNLLKQKMSCLKECLVIYHPSFY